MNKKEDKKMLSATILLYKQKVAQTPEVKKMIQKLQQRLDKLNKNKWME
jgi:hypothetical protein